jgi:hypothetical protein
VPLLRAGKNTFAFEMVNGVPLRRKVMYDQFVPSNWFGDEACTQPVDGVVPQEIYFSSVYHVPSRPHLHRYRV